MECKFFFLVSFFKQNLIQIKQRYKYLRHPSYVGFFYWSIGTQITLGNYVNIILYSVISWRFFESRINYEEYTLLKLFPNGHYENYKKNTFIGIPFINTS